jgi:Flp pilus assembly protein TadD/DNA-binding MarR family transcriptional regulator
VAGKKVLISRFTPSLMAPKMLEAIFVQRESIAVDTVDRIRESVLHDNKHYLLFIGPRGCGKTHFVSLIFHRLKRMEDLRAGLRVAWLNEDKTSTSVLDLNRRVYETLSADYPDEFTKDQLDAMYDLPPADAATYVQQLLNRRLGDKSALIIVENLDGLFENLGRQGQHDWRGFLQESGKFTILATAQQLFPGVSDRSLPFYGFFQTAYLKPLSVQEGRELLKNIATQQEDAELAGFLDTPEGRSRVRTLHHLSGGNHRVYVVFSEFINRKSLDELVTPFEKTLDELTPYYQERLRWLTPQQRMIVEHLCASDRALPVKEIARALFASNQTIAKQLADLKQKRYVQSAKRGRESLYELTEPLMRLAMELKENRGGPVRLIVDFLRVWYSREELQTRLRSLPDTERMERIHVESAIAQIDCGAENLRVRALLADIGELAYRGDEQGILEAVGELQAAAGAADYGKTAARVWEQLEGRFPSLRVGARFAAEGIPPQLVFLTPPPRSQEESPQDQGPAPPAPGEEATLEMGYDEEDLRALALVGDYRFGSIVPTLPDQWPKLPPHPQTAFDEGDFVRWLRGSISLTIDEKHHILAAIPRHSQFQIDNLLRILTDERSKFANLSPKHLLQVRKMERQCARDWCQWLCAGINSADARSWLDGHANDELADLVLAAEVSTGNDRFPLEHQFSHQLGIAGWHVERGQQDQADEWIKRTRAFVEQIEEDSTQIDLLKKLASQLRRWKRFDAALEVLHQAGEKAPDDASIHSGRGYCLSGLRQYNEALDAHSQAIRLDEKTLFRRLDRAAVLLDLQRPQEALGESCWVVDRDATLVDGWNRKAEALRELGRYDEAWSANDEAIKLAPDRSDAWRKRGIILDAAGRFAKAVDAYTKGIELDPNDAVCFNNKAVSLYALGKYDEALESVTESLRLLPNNPNVHFTRVEILLSGGQWEKGWAEAEKCLQQFPPQSEPTGYERYVIQVIFRSTQRLELWTERIARLCQLFEGANAFAYLGQGLVRTLRTLADDQVSSEVLTRWHSAWHQVGDQYDELGFSLRLFDAGIEYLKTREPNALLDLPLEQRAILEQLFDIDVAHDD